MKTTNRVEVWLSSLQVLVSFCLLWLKLILSGHRFLSTMPISKEQHDELCTSYAALALYDGDVSCFQTAPSC